MTGADRRGDQTGPSETAQPSEPARRSDPVGSGESARVGDLRRTADLPCLPVRPADGHKGTFGTVLILAGQVGMAGAAILAARGALRGGAGLVRVGLPRELLNVLPVAVPAATTVPVDPAEHAMLAEAIRVASTVVVGPGLGKDARARFVVESVWRHARGTVVIDADGLNALGPLDSTGVDPRFAALRARGATPILTPHPGEAARLLATDSAGVQRDRVAAVLELARASAGVAILKGAGTLVCDREALFTNTTGNPGLGTGGSGDVLAGLIGALAAQGLVPFAAACLAVHVHGAAGDRVAAELSEPGLTAEDLPVAIARELADHVGGGTS